LKIPNPFLKNPTSFLKISRTGGAKMIPNVRHVSSNSWINFGFEFTTQLPKWFCVIWILLFLIPFWGFQNWMPDENKGINKEIQEILSNSNQELLPKLEAELNNKIHTDQEVIRLNEIVKNKNTELMNKQSEIDRLKAILKTLTNKNNSVTEESEKNH
ncbi:MAG: hypothetical protein AB4372_22370, partial [Xenococcus sp. (in: cyanobacteria)]